MDPEKTTEQITNNDNYSLSLITDGVCLQITLTIKVSKTRTDIYQIVLKQIKQIQKLCEYFDDLSKLREHIRDQNNIQVDLHKKIIRILKVVNMEENIIGEVGVLVLDLLQIRDQSIQEIQHGPAFNFIDQQCQDYKRIILNNNTIKSKQLSNIFGKKRLKGLSTFSVKFTKIDHYVSVGVIDAQNKYGKWNSNYVFYYNDGDCRLSGNKQSRSQGFKCGQIVNVVVNFNKGIIQWKVDTIVRYQTYYSILNDPEIIWVPFIGLYNKNDSVEIVQL